MMSGLLKKGENGSDIHMSDIHMVFHLLCKNFLLQK